MFVGKEIGRYKGGYYVKYTVEKVLHRHRSRQADFIANLMIEMMN